VCGKIGGISERRKLRKKKPNGKNIKEETLNAEELSKQATNKQSNNNICNNNSIPKFSPLLVINKPKEELNSFTKKVL
jgi:hypothetical protein